MRKLQPGETVEGRYVIDRLLASGGQAHVYRARHTVLDRMVAIKLLRNHGSPEVQSRMTRRFEQEARLISRLKDPHTITLYDFGRLPTGSLFMVFEYIDGISLKELVANEGAIAPHRVAKILRQTLSSLHEAHSMGVLHRDLKPANIMLFEHAGRQDQVKLLDFGIAKILREESMETMESLTGANNLVGTPRYIAPEAYQAGVEMGTQADIYSLGLVAYELLLGEPAIKGETAVEVFRSQLTQAGICLPPTLQLPEGLRKVIDQMLERDLRKRYLTCEHVLWALRSWQQDDPTSGTSPGVALPRRFDPQDVAIPDPYEDVAPTQAISGKVLESLNFLPNVPVEPLSEAEQEEREPAPPPKGPSDSSEYISRSALKESGALPALRATPSAGLPPIASPRKIERPAPAPQIPEPKTQILADVSSLDLPEPKTQILPNVSHIDALLLGVTRPDFTAYAPKSDPQEERTVPELDARAVIARQKPVEKDDATAQIKLSRELLDDIALAKVRAELSEVSELEEHLDPDDVTVFLPKLPPPKSAAVLKRRPRKKKDTDDDSRG